jgi:NAD(P)-dependent dehydrogenase (short-subunit alcohol dehydrogenase family)
MESKVIFITGVSTGLGRALAEEALSADYHVAGTVKCINTMEEMMSVRAD